MATTLTCTVGAAITITDTLTSNGVAINLSGKTVYLVGASPKHRFKETATVVSAPDGTVSLSTAIPVAGDYDMQWLVMPGPTYVPSAERNRLRVIEATG